MGCKEAPLVTSEKKMYKTNTGRTILYRVRKARRKTASIRVHSDGSVQLAVPLHMSDSAIDKLLFRRSAWLEKAMLRQQQRIRLDGYSFISGESISFLGNSLQLDLRESKRSRVYILDNSLVIESSDLACSAAVERTFYKWLRSQANHHFELIFKAARQRFSDPFPVPVTLKIRKMKSRWGSCGSHGVVHLNLKLIQVPYHCIEMVICHELCHLWFPDHSRNYYRKLSEVMPEWREYKSELDNFNIF